MLRHKAMLLVLDNCEHVLEGAASLVAAILRHCPQLRILATSREALSISGESVFLMPSLAVPSVSPTLTAAVALRSDAVRLFAERAADALGTYTLTDADAQAVATICRQAGWGAAGDRTRGRAACACSSRRRSRRGWRTCSAC